MAGAASTITYDNGYDHAGHAGRVRKVIIDWTSDASTGAVTATTGKIVGRLLKVVTDPGATAPTDNYDIAITDEKGIDVLSGLAGTGGTDPSLANRDTANTELAYLVAENSLTDAVHGSQPYVCDALSVAVTNAGNSKQGQIIIYYEV